MLTDIHLIIYDLDGVLVDISDTICLSFNAALEDAGEPPCTEEVIRSMIGIPLDEMYRRVPPQERWTLIEGCFNRYREVFNDISVEHTRMLNGARDQQVDPGGGEDLRLPRDR
jgi:phosphoglycolate phosphatase